MAMPAVLTKNPVSIALRITGIPAQRPAMPLFEFDCWSDLIPFFNQMSVLIFIDSTEYAKSY